MEFDADQIVELMRRLEHNYNLRPRHPERQNIYSDYAARSHRFRSSAANWKSFLYAAPERCGIDWFPARLSRSGTPTGGVPLFIFIHGGFWRTLDRRVFSFIAEHYVNSGISVAMIGYELTPTVKLEHIVEQVAQAMLFLNRHADELGFDTRRVSVSGHSAGGHLAAMVSAIPPSRLGGHQWVCTVPVSGVFSLAPLLLTSVNHDVRMTPDEALRLSPSVITEFHTNEFIVAVGEYETDGFIGQSRDFVKTATAAGTKATLKILERRTHFDILEELARPELPLCRRVVDTIIGAS